MLAKPQVHGKATFKHKMERVPAQVENILKLQQWSIHRGQYTKLNWKLIFEQLATANITLLYLYDNFYQPILKQISIVSFPSLRAISLVNNNITNIQAFCFISCKRITHIYFNFNHIQSIDCLNKCQLVNLQYFSLRKNPINEIDMGRYRTNQLKTVLFQGILEDPIQPQDCSFLAKIKSYNLNQNHNFRQNLGIIGVKCEQRLRQDRMIKVLSRKFKNLKLDYPKRQKVD